DADHLCAGDIDLAAEDAGHDVARRLASRKKPGQAGLFSVRMAGLAAICDKIATLLFYLPIRRRKEWPQQ
ncbi:MAG: hypothetical protein Q8O52_02405, partial [Sulfuritalea sp.]|nr:hypothetical protein [Sulfuritalea sp.]